MRSKEDDWKRWFLQGLQDLEDARFNLSGGRYNVACFLAQQSAGKVLKSFLHTDSLSGRSAGRDTIDYFR